MSSLAPGCTAASEECASPHQGLSPTPHHWEVFSEAWKLLLASFRGQAPASSGSDAVTATQGEGLPAGI